MAQVTIESVLKRVRKYKGAGRINWRTVASTSSVIAARTRDEASERELTSLKFDSAF